MSKPSDFLGASPKTVLNKPFMHVQDQKPSGTAGGASVAGDNDRVLNTVLKNAISGASLSNNTVTLPAGTYYMEAETQGVAAAVPAGLQASIRDTSDNTLIRGVNSSDSTSSSTTMLCCAYLNGEVTLTETTDIKLVSWVTKAKTVNGLGMGHGSGDIEIFSELRVWQLDAVVKTPIIVNDKLFPLPSNSMVTGNMHGLEYAKTGGNQVTVQAGICMDSLNETVLSLATQQVVTIGAVINTIYNLFLCDDGVVRTDTDVDGANLGAYKVRWIGFVLTEGDGTVAHCRLKGDTLSFTTPITAATGIGGSWVEVSLSPFVPTSRARLMHLGCYLEGEGAFQISTNGGVSAAGGQFSSTWSASSGIGAHAYQETVHCLSKQQTGTLHIQGLALKR